MPIRQRKKFKNDAIKAQPILYYSDVFENKENEFSLVTKYESQSNGGKIYGKETDSRFRSEKSSRDNTISISELDLSVDIRDDPILKMFSTKGPSGFYCKTCGEFSNHGLTMKKHIQRNHMNDIQHSCRICGKGFSSRNRLTSHLMSEHKP